MDHRLSFRGSAKEYFGIWIVNTLLTIVTLGIYSAWAKVRRRRFFAGSVLLENEPFEYLALPMAIFRGWLIAAAALLVYWVANRIAPALGVAVTLAIVAALPWVVVKSRVFNARNQAYRNVRFRHAPKYAEAYRVLLGLSLLIPLTLGILAPYVFFRHKRFQIENTSYGTTPFRFTARPGEFYRPFLAGALLFLGSVAAVGILTAVALASGGSSLPAAGTAIAFLPMLATAGYLVAFVYVKTRLANLAWNRTELGDMRFTSAMSPWRVAWLYLSGGAAVLVSLGLLFPWAAVRLARYRCETLTVRSVEGIERFVADTSAADAGAAGEEIGEMLGLDVDIAF